MTHWHYQAMRHKTSDGEEFFTIHEYYELDGEPLWTAEPVTICGSTINELKEALERMLKDVDKYGIKDYK